MPKKTKLSYYINIDLKQNLIREKFDQSHNL